MANNNLKILLEKELHPNLKAKFNYEYDEDKNIHNWQLLLQNSNNNEKLILDSFSYEETQLPFLLTPDIWQETIYSLFSCLDAIIVNNNEILVLYDMFGDVYFKNYKIDVTNKTIIKDKYSIKKYNMSFLLGYNMGCGKLLNINKEVYAYYSAAAPPRQNLVCFSLEKKMVKQIVFDNNITIKENDFTILNILHKQNENKLILSHYLSNILNKSINICEQIKDVNANQQDSIRGLIYYFSEQNEKVSIIRFDLLEQEWLISDYEEVEIKPEEIN